MFAIHVLPATQLGPTGERLGSITIGDYSEHFACHPTDLSVEEFANRWNDELRGIVNGASSVALVHDPRFAWVVYRDDEWCYVQQLFAPDGRFDPVPSRTRFTDDGERVSEWSVPLRSIVEFVES